MMLAMSIIKYSNSNIFNLSIYLEITVMLFQTPVLNIVLSGGPTFDVVCKECCHAGKIISVLKII